MRKWKRVVSALLAGVVIMGNSLFVLPKEAQASNVTSQTGNIASKILYSDTNGEAEVYLGPVGGEVNAGKSIFTWTGGTGDDQMWSAEETSDEGIYRLSVTKQGTTLYLSVSNESDGNEASLATGSDNDKSQQWVFESTREIAEGFYRIKNVNSGLYLTSPRTKSADEPDLSNIVQKALEENSESQLWKPGFTVEEFVDPSIPDLGTEASEGYLTSKAAPKQHLSVDGGKAEEGKGIIIWQGPEPNQQWSFEPIGTEGEYVIKNKSTDMVISSADTAENSQLVQKIYVKDDNKQIWIFETVGSSDEGYRIKNKETNFYATAESVDNLAKVSQKAIDTTSTLQVWQSDAEITASKGEEITEPTNVDHLASAADEGQYLSVSGGSTKEGEELMTWTGPGNNQKWKFQETSDGSKEYYIVNTNSNKAISAQNMMEGKRLVQKGIVADDDKQVWSFIKAKDGGYKIKNKATHLYLTADVSASGSRILQKNLMDSLLQIWNMPAKTTVNTVQDTDDCVIKIWITEGVTVTSDQGAAVTKGKPVTFTLTPRDGYDVKDMRFFINGKEQTLTDGGNGMKTCTVSSASEDMTVKAKTDAACLNGYVYIPENDYTGRNQCLSPRVVEGLDGTLYATFENGIPSEIEEGEYSFPVYESKDKGDTWKRVGEVINDDSVHPDSYYKITKYTDIGAPSEAVETTEGAEGAIRHPWSLQCCPQLFVLPEDQGDLKKGTLICAGVAVPLEEGAETVSDAGYGGLWDSSLDFYYSTDGGRSWIFKSTIAEGGANGRNIMGYDPVWEPFFLYHEKNLICYYSDETDPAHAQKLVYKITTDGGATWGEAVDIVSINNRGARPGMPIVTELENGDWMMVYETVGMTSPIKSGVKIAKDPYNWNPSDPGPTLPAINGVFGGSPYVFTLQDKRVVAGTGSLSEVFINSKNDGTGEWVAKETGAPAGYNRCFFQLSTGEFYITGTEGAGFASQNNKIFVKRVWPDEVPKDEKGSIEFTAPTKTKYKVGEKLDLSGMKMIVVYSNGDKEDVTDKVKVEGFDPTRTGVQNITVTYEGETAVFTVTVEKENQNPTPSEPSGKVLESIIVILPTKTEYKLGEKLSLSGMKMTAIYSNGDKEDVTGKVTAEGFDSTTEGVKKIVLKYENKIVEYEIIVKKENKKPDKVQKPNEEKPKEKVDVTGNTISLNNKAKVSVSGAKLKVAWGKVKGADGYDVYAAKCGSSMKLTKSVKGSAKTSYVISKIGKQKTSKKYNYKVQVRAYRMVNGKKQTIGKSLTMHAVGKAKKNYTNAKSIKVSKEKITLKTGKTQKIKATISKQDSKKKVLPKKHVAVYRYYSTNKNVATVSKGGIIKGKRKGTCTVYAVAANGVKKGIKVTVK